MERSGEEWSGEEWRGEVDSKCLPWADRESYHVLLALQCLVQFRGSYAATFHWTLKPKSSHSHEQTYPE